MTATAPIESALELPCYVAGEPVLGNSKLEVHYPYTGEVSGVVPMLGRSELDASIDAALSYKEQLTRYQRYEILERARVLLSERAEEFAHLIRSEAGLCMRETHYEVGRAQDVLQFAAMESLKDDGQIFSCDVSPQGKARKIFTIREPLNLAAAITPFNHPLNQVAHKLAPAIAAGVPVVLKPSNKTHTQPHEAGRGSQFHWAFCGLPTRANYPNEKRLPYWCRARLTERTQVRLRGRMLSSLGR